MIGRKIKVKIESKVLHASGCNTRVQTDPISKGKYSIKHEWKYTTDYGNDMRSYSETLEDAIIEVENEALRTIVPRYQNDIVIKNLSGDIVAILPWIGIYCDDPHYWCPSSKIRPPTYGDWIRKDET